MKQATLPTPPLSRRVVYATVIVIVLLGLIEGTARLLTRELGSQPQLPKEVGWQATFFRSIFDWNEPDPYLLWRFRPNLHNPLISTNSRGLIADEVGYAKPAQTLRVVVLGDSSPVGLGLKSRMDAFPEVLRRLLADTLGQTRRVEMINASVTGYTSEQIARLYDMEMRKYGPDYVILYCGNNDASVSGPWSDQELLGAQRAAGLRRLLAHSAAYRLLRDLIVQKKRGDGDSQGALVPRVSAERYGDNLNHIAEMCSDDGARLILVVPPQRYLWPAGLQFKILSHLTGEDGEFVFPPQLGRLLNRRILYCLDSTRFSATDTTVDYITRAIYRSAASDSLDPNAAVRFWRDVADREPAEPIVANNLGVALWRNREWTEADRVFAAARRIWVAKDGGSVIERDAAGSPILFNRAINILDWTGDTSMIVPTGSTAFLLLDSALQTDWMSLRIKQPYIEVLNGFRHRSGVAVVDVRDDFRASGGDQLFVDHCHPTREGHEILARALARAIVRQELGAG